MKITHKSKRAIPPHPEIASLIADIQSISTDDLPQFLSVIDSWKWPRSDLNSWIKVLNKFDTILEEVIRDYDVDRLQLNVFTPQTKAIVCEVLRFERLLLENSTNRKMFNSYDRLNSLLFTSDLDVLVATLLLLLRPSQQYSSQPALSHSLHISTSRLESLARHWPSLREHALDMLEMVSERSHHRVANLPSEASEVNFSFYRRVEGDKDVAKDKGPELDNFESTSTTTHVQSSGQPSGPVNIHIESLAASPREATDILADAIESYSVPDGEKFELMCRIRAARALGAGRHEDRQKLVVIRLISMAVYAHTHNEAQAQSSLFLYEPDLITRVAELLQLDRSVPTLVQTAAIAALDAFARYRNKIQEVLTAVNAGVNHGILMSLLRKTVQDVASPESVLPHLFVDALLSFVIYLASHAAGGNMVVGAGLVPLLIQIIENKLPERLAIISKTMQLVDNVLYGFINAFQIFCHSRGVEVLTERIQFEVNIAIEMFAEDDNCHTPSGVHGLLPFARTGLLKHTLRSMHRMMQSSGTTEGLRGLIDSSLLKSVKNIIEYRGLFGPTVLPIAINIMATFVHNEPTSLAVIQEAGLPEVFYKTIEAGLEPSIEVIQAIPNAIGALCLNQAGQDQLAARPSIIPGLFSIFTSERHLRILQDKENAALIGSSVDELIRHHPSLKTAVFDALKSTLGKIEDLGNAYAPQDDIKQWYQLTLVSTTTSNDDDIVMGNADTVEPVQDAVTIAHGSTTTSSDDVGATGDDPASKVHDNIVVAYIDVLGRCLEGLFQHVPHCKDFISNTDGLNRLTRLMSLPCLPYDFANSISSDSLVQVIRTMTEVSPRETLGHLAKQVKNSLEETKDFWQALNAHSRLLPFVDASTEQELAIANNCFRRLVTLHIRITLLSDVYSTVGYTHGRGAVSLLPILTGPGSPEIIPDLGALHRACIWENIVFKSGLNSKGIELSLTASAPSPEGPSDPALPLADGNTGSPVTTSIEQASDLKKDETSKVEGPSDHNARALKHIAGQIPSSLAPFFQAVARMFMYGRRNPDLSQKRQAAATSAAVADVMLNHLTQRPSGDTLSVYAYYTIMLGLITVLLFDERTAQNSLHAMLLMNFRRVAGLNAVLDICRPYVDAVARITDINPSDRSESDKQELVHVYGGLKVALHLLHSLVSYKPSSESGQNTLFFSQGKPESSSDYYEPHDFLVKMRLTVLPFIRELWQAPWLVFAPPGVSKYVIQSILEVIGGENEESRGGTSSESIPATGPGLLRPSGPEEERIRQLTDMGFPRSAAIRALTRSHNNVSVATEFLLAHPFPLPPDVDMDVAGNAESADDAAEEEDEPPSNFENNIGESISVDDMAIPSNESPAVFQDEGSAADRRQKLSLARESLTSDIGRLSLRLVDAHPSVIFDVRPAFIGPSDGYQGQGVRCIVDDIRNFSPSAYDVHEEPLAVRCRLLALVLSDSPSTALRVTDNDEQNLMDVLLALLLSTPASLDKDQPSIPKWLASHLLVTESLLVLGEEPRGITLPLVNEQVQTEELLTGPSYSEARPILFDFCIRLMGILPLPRDELLATLRVLVQLTRDHAIAKEFVRRDGLTLLLKHLKSPTGETTMAGCHSYIAIILRHLVEDPATLEHIMRQDIKRLFSHPRTRVADVTNYVRNCGQMAARDPRVFIRVTKSICHLLQPDTPVNHIALKSTVPATADVTPSDGSEKMSAMQVDAPYISSTTTTDDLEAVVHFMVGELMRVGKSVCEKISKEVPSSPAKQEGSGGPDGASEPSAIHTAAASATGVPQNASASEAKDTTKDDHSDFFYACFLMQCLTELLFSYDSCKSAFLSYSRKRTQTPTKDPVSRHKAVALNFLLSDLISFGAFDVEPKFDARKRIMLCNWAMSVIVALCVDCSSSYDSKDVSVDLTSIRKVALEAISRSIKDAPPSESVDARYGRLLALADLCHRLLTVRFNAGAKPQEETPLRIAKVMLEKNYVATLTNLLSDIDLNYPNMRSLVTAVLRPLEQLTKIAIKMGRATDKNKELPDLKSESSSSVSSERDEEESMAVDNGREETPDLYRNSSLGMYGGEMEDVNYVPGDEMDQDGDDDDDEEVEMEYDEETGSEDTSNTDEEVGEDGDIDVGVDESGEAWPNEDEDMDDDEGGTDDDESEDEQEVEDVGDEEMMWQDVSGPDSNAPDGLADDIEDEEELGGMPILEDEEADEEADVLSEEEDVADDLGMLEETDRTHAGSDDPFGFGRQVMRGMGFREDRILFGGGGTGSRGRVVEVDPDMQIFGRPRQISTGLPEAMTHPLLVDTSGSSLPPTGQSRGLLRRSQRGVVSGSSYGDLMQTIEELVGGGAMQLFQQLISRSRGGIGADIRVEVPAPGLIAGSERGQIHRHGRAPISATMRLERDPRSVDGRTESHDLTPLSTSQRWAEEAKISHGKLLQERLGKLSNHVTLSLLPEARVTALKAKEKAEKEKAEKEKAEKEKAEKEEAEKAEAEKERARNETADESTAAVHSKGEATPVDRTQTPNEDGQSEEDASNQGLSAVEQEDHDEMSRPAMTSNQDTEMDDTVLAERDRIQVATVPFTSIEGSSDQLLPGTQTDSTRSQAPSRQEPVATTSIPAELEPTPVAASSESPNRVTVMIHGSAVDITDTGIDPTFLEALPDDMREEVLNQHFRERRTSRVEQPPESQISPEFLDALPPEIRAEILQQERLERSRRERSQNNQPTGAPTGDGPTGPVEIDPASFIASLDPQLRQVVLLDQDDVFLQTLPSHMIAEAGVYRDGSHHIHQHARRDAIAAPTSSQSPRKVPAPRDAIQLLDRSGITTLVRLLFFPQLLRKNVLHKVLLNLCENTKSRTDLFNLLLSILQDGTADLVVVDRSFAQMSFRNSKSSLQNTLKVIGKQKANTDFAASPQLSSEIPPDLIAQRALDALAFIVGANEMSSLFFLTEHELPTGLKRTISKKGKGKEKQAAQSHYPIVLLLGLLDRQTLLKTPSIMDSVAGLLAAVTRPLTNLQDNKKGSGSPPHEPVMDAAASHDGTQNVAAATESSSTMTVPEPTATPSDPSQDQAISGESLEEKILLASPPQIPHPALCLIVNILTVGECSGRTFQHTLALIQHLFCIPDAREVIAQELKAKAQDFGQSLYLDLNELAIALQNEPAQNELPSSLTGKFSPASSDQAKLLRVLKTIDYMYSSKSPKPVSAPGAQDALEEDAVHTIYESFRFAPLWRKLGDCLAVVEQKSDFEHIATILLPLIESLMVVCKYVGSKSTSATRSIRPPGSPRTPISRESTEDLFVQFTDAHRKILNLMVRNNPSLMSGSFSLLINNPRVLDFDNKRNYFNQQLRRRPHPREHHGTLQLNVRRARVFEDSFQYLQRKTGDQIKYGKLSVRFYDEEGVDAGGVTREWFQILARQMFNPNYALFEPCAADKQTYQPNRASAVNNEHLSFFKFVGRVIGKAIYDGRLLDAYFARSLYRQLLGKPVDYRDVEWVDPEYYNSLCWILENDPTALDLTFITEVDEFGKRDIIPLKEGGTSTPVTQENKKEYVQLSAQYRLHSSIKEQIESLLGGFYEIVPKDLISIFNEQEVELLISGTPDIDVDEWRAATEYNGYTSSDPAIVWWWRALKSFNRDERAKVLSFATGTSRVPLGGFVELQGVQGVQRFSIHRAYGDSDRLPQAHTCFNQIDLPQYTSYEMLRQQLLLAINEGGEGFGFA